MDSPGLVSLSEGSSSEIRTGFYYPFKPAATFFGSLSGMAWAVPESTSREWSFDSEEVSEMIRHGDMTAKRETYWGY